MKSKILLLILTVFSVFALNAQWIQTNGPEGTQVCFVKRVGAQLWTGTRTGLYISTDEGLSWQKSSLLNDDLISDVYVTGDTIMLLYFARNPSTHEYSTINLLRSFDGGQSWKSPNFIKTWDDPWPLPVIIRCQSALFYQPNADEADVYRSMDKGATWSALSFPDMYVNSCKISNFGIWVITYDSAINVKSFISSDMGQSWIQKPFFQPGTYVGYLKDSLIILSALDSLQNSLIIRSTDLLQTWDTVFLVPQGIYPVHIFEYDGSLVIYTNQNNAVGPPFISNDNGITWQPWTWPADFFWHSVLVADGDKLQWDNFYKIMRYNWTQDSSVSSSTGLNAQLILTLFAVNDILYARDVFGLQRSSDNGLTWQLVSPEKQYNYSSAMTDMTSSHDTIFYVDSYYLGRSFDNGLTWDTLGLPGESQNDYSNYNNIEYRGHRIFLAERSLWYSDDYGQTWDTLVSFPNSIYPSEKYGALKIYKNKLFGLKDDGTFYCLNESTGQWDLKQTFWQTGVTYLRLYTFDSTMVLCTSSTLKYTTDGGNSLITPLNNGLPDDQYGEKIYPLSIQAIGNTWFGSVTKKGVYYTTDHGNNWAPLAGGNIPFIARSLAIANGVLFAGTDWNSVWRRANAFVNVSGTVYNDYNNNGIQDAGEPGLPYYTMSTSPVSFSSSTDFFGAYQVNCDVPGDTLRPACLGPGVSVNPQFRIINSPAINQDFGIHPVPGVHDLSVDLTNVNIFHAGFSTLINIHTFNKGNTQSPQVLFIKDNQLSYVSANFPPAQINGDTILWQLDSLQFLQSFDIQVSVQTSNTTAIGDTITCKGYILPIIVDTLPTDNLCLLKKTCMGAYDPNDKTCEQGEYFLPAWVNEGYEMQFTIRFQNTGNLPTSFITIKDTLSPFLDWGSFRVISSSHPVIATIQGEGVVSFTFNPINLLPASLSDLQSIGYVKYGIRCRPGTPENSIITNTSYIYFDFNPPIQTNTTSTQITDLMTFTTTHPLNVQTINIYPNPANTELNILIKGQLTEVRNLSIYDICGKVLLQSTLHGQSSMIDISGLKSGIYLGNIRAMDGKQIGNFKFIVR